MSFKVGEHTPKYMLKRLAERYYPRAFVYRRKAGFGVPFFRWLSQPDYRPFLDAVRRGFMVQSGGLAPKRARKLANRARSGRDLCAANTAWTLGAFERWRRLFVDGEGKALAAAPRVDQSSRVHALVLGDDVPAPSPVPSGLE